MSWVWANGPPAEGRQRRTGNQRPQHLPGGQRHVRGLPQAPGDDEKEGVEDAAGEGDECVVVERAGRGLERDEDAEKADRHRRPAAPADPLLEEERRQHRHIDRAGEVVGDGVGERQAGHRPVEQQHLGRGEDHPEHMQPRPLDREQRADAAAQDERADHQHRGNAAHEQHLAGRIRPRHPFGQRVIGREQHEAGQHQADAGRDVLLVVDGNGWSGEGGHEGAA